MFHTPAHKQVSPIALPAQIHLPLAPEEREEAMERVDLDLWVERRLEEQELRSYDD